MAFYQWALLDVIAVFACALYLTYKSLILVMRFLYRSIISSPSTVHVTKMRPVVAANGKKRN